MIVKAIILTLAISFTAMVAAQSNDRLSLGAEAAHPLGSFGQQFGFGYGATLGVEVIAATHFSLIAQAGFIRFSGINSQIGSFQFPALNTIPVQVGGRYYFRDDHLGMYLGAMGGAHFTMVEGGDTENHIIAAPLIGLMLTPNFDLTFRYQMFYDTYEENGNQRINTEGYLALRAAYVL